MKSLLWTGKLSFPVRLLVNVNNLLAWLLGNTRNESEMKERVKLGYDGKFTDHVRRYDELSAYYQKRAALAQLDGLDFTGKNVLDIGCGTGIISFLAYESGCVNVTCGDISEYMLSVAHENSKKREYDLNRIQFHQLDAESLPFDDESFDIVITGMAFGLFPDQEKAVKEMYRVLRPGGVASIGAHGPEHYWEAVDANVRALRKKHLMGYRFEFWPRTEKQVQDLLKSAGFNSIRTNRFIWRNLFSNPAEACDFFAAVSSNWWYAKIPGKSRAQEYERTRSYFIKKGVRTVTDDIIVAYGVKF